MRRCESCFNWSPHIKYSFVGFCLKKGETSFRESFCEFFTELKFEEEFLYCEDCKTFIFSEELEEHLEKRHCIFRSVFLDWDYREEVYEG